jgi:purine-binding chemotaxis protein CheW
MPNPTTETSSAGPHKKVAITRSDTKMSPINSHGGEQTSLRAEVGNDRAGKYLSFLLAGEEFAIRILYVREIIGLLDITSVPQTPSYVKGVINLRGKVIPVIDLRLKLRLPEMDPTQRTCIIVVEMQSAGVTLHTGIIVDAVCEVLNLHPDDIEDSPNFGDGAAESYLLGMAKIKGKVKILIDINRLLSAREVHELDTRRFAELNRSREKE